MINLDLFRNGCRVISVVRLACGFKQQSMNGINAMETTREIGIFSPPEQGQGQV